MENIKQVKKRVFLLSAFGLLSNLLLSGLNLGEVLFENNRDNQSLRFLSGPQFILWDMAGRYFFIWFCFSLFIGLFLVRRKVFFKLLGIFPLLFTGMQLLISMKVKYQTFSDELSAYPKLVEILFLTDFGLLVLTIILLAFHIHLVWFIHRSPIYNHL